MINIGNKVFKTLLAVSEREQQRGLMFIDPPTPVMAFVYSRSQVNKFWMANTKAPLDIVFSHKGIIKQICKGEPFSTTMIGDNTLSDLVVEFPQGTCEKEGISVGQEIRFFGKIPNAFGNL